MIVLAREVFVCKCSTETHGAAAGSDGVHFVRGETPHLSLLDPAHHSSEHVADFRARLARREHWLLGLQGERVVTYTWLHARRRCDYPYLPGCGFDLAPDVGYGYDAWTPPELRGSGLRRRAFVEELGVLRTWGKAWEASFFVAHQLDGARRSLGHAGIAVLPLWRVALRRDRSLAVERLTDRDDEHVRPSAATPVTTLVE
jgi:hypothetical protein